MDAKTLEMLIATGETNTLELKVAPPRPADLAERICGMANGAGGYIVIGVADENWGIVGVNNLGDAIDNLMQAARLCKPNLRFEPEEPEIVIIQGKKVIVASVPPNEGTLYQSGNTFWIRRGTHSISFTSQEIKDFLYRTGSLSWETQPVLNTTLEDLNPQLLELYIEQRARRGTSPKRLKDLPNLLVTLGCAKITPDRQGIEVIRPTNAGLLLFGDTPQDFIRQAEVVCVLFSDTIGMRRYRDRRVLNGSISELIEKIENFLSANIKVSAQTQGFHRVDIPDYPLEALREGVVNALVHRDYNLLGETVRIFFYPDRVEIHSPGRLLSGVNLDALIDGQFLSKPRNPIICDLLKEFPGNYMERMGSGIKYMVDTMREMKKPEPEFKEAGEFVVTFYNGIESENQMLETIPEALATNLPGATLSHQGDASSGTKLTRMQRQTLALGYVQTHGVITNKEYRQLTGASESAALRDLEDLVERGSLRAKGDKRTRKYLL